MAFALRWGIFLLTLDPARAGIVRRKVLPCAPVHMISARGSTETAGPGVMRTLADIISQTHPEATLEPVEYPAELKNYQPSVTTGTLAVTNQIASYARRCPDTRIVLMGYSQGAHVMGDALCGGDSVERGPVTPPLDENIASHVAAVVWYGDPRFVAGKSFNKGNATTSGIFERPGDQSCDRYKDRIASFCDEGDTICSSTGDDLAVHFTYTMRYNDKAAEFVNQRLATRNTTALPAGHFRGGKSTGTHP